MNHSELTAAMLAAWTPGPPPRGVYGQWIVQYGNGNIASVIGRDGDKGEWPGRPVAHMPRDMVPRYKQPRPVAAAEWERSQQRSAT
jgi:hypothetical protein